MNETYSTNQHLAHKESYRSACEIEEDAKKDLIPHLKNTTYKYVFTKTEQLQRDEGDVLIIRQRKHPDEQIIFSVEIKAEQANKYNNFFLEAWSNKSRKTKGWFYTLKRTDLLWYYFLRERCLYEIDFKKLRHWAFGKSMGVVRVESYPEREQRLRCQLNDTWGWCVPIKQIQRVVGYEKTIIKGRISDELV